MVMCAVLPCQHLELRSAKQSREDIESPEAKSLSATDDFSVPLPVDCRFPYNYMIEIVILPLTTWFPACANRPQKLAEL